MLVGIIKQMVHVVRYLGVDNLVHMLSYVVNIYSCKVGSGIPLPQNYSPS